MIDLKEFRVGNHVNVDNELATITFLNNDPDFIDTPALGYKTATGSDFRRADDDGVAPVPITDELLEKLEFSFHSYFKLWQRARPQGIFTLDLDRDYTALDFAHRPIVKEIRHLHTLENLYFALSGTELVFRKPKVQATA